MKNNINWILILFVSTITILSCKKEETPLNKTYEDIENEFKEINYAPGTQDISIEITSQLTYTFRVSIPDVDLTQNIPLILNLHGASGGHPDAHKSTDCYIVPGMEGVDAIFLTPNSGVTTWGTSENQDKLRILMDLSTRLWRIDQSKVAVMGYSSGGNGAWLFCETQSQLFSAGIAMASGYNVFTPDNEVRTIPVPMFVINGENDELFPIDTVSYWVEQTQLAGSDIEFVVAPGLGHTTPCEYVPHLKKAAKWLEEEVWK